jgi:hypothetical protein
MKLKKLGALSIYIPILSLTVRKLAYTTIEMKLPLATLSKDSAKREIFDQEDSIKRFN